MIVSVCPTSIVTEVGAIDTVGAESTLTAAFVSGVTVSGVGLRGGFVNGNVPVSDIVTVSTQVVVVPLGV